MPQVTVTIAGRVYRMACGEGEEAHLEALSKDVDQRITDLRKAFGEIGDMRLHVMAALSVADELSEAQEKCIELEQVLAIQQQQRREDQLLFKAHEEQFAEHITQASERIRQLASALSTKNMHHSES
jgi:cell division protein ZapA